MAIRIIPIGEKGEIVYGPVVICDACAEPIAPEEEGLYVWAYKEGEMIEHRFFHHNNEQTNPSCQTLYSRWDREKREKGYTVQWGTMMEFVSQLAHNLGVKPKVEEIPEDKETSVHALLTILRGFLYLDGHLEKCKELTEEIHEVQLWLEDRKAKRQIKKQGKR